MTEANVADEVPSEPLEVSHTSTGFMPDVAIHRRGDQWHHESSYSHFWFFGVMCLIGIAACFIPWNARSFFDIPVRYFVAGGFFWGAVCGLVPYFIRNRIGQRIVIDTNTQVVTINRKDTSNIVSKFAANPVSILTADPPALPTTTVRFADVIGVQLIHGGRYQANLVYRQDGEIVRHNLHSHGGKRFPLAIAKVYCQAGGFEFIDQVG